MPEHIDFSIDEFMRCNRLDGVEILSYMIFVKALSNNNLMKLFAEYEMVRCVSQGAWPLSCPFSCV